MQISISMNNSKAYFQPIEIKDEVELINYAKQYSISLGTFNNNHRTLANFKSCEIIGLDIDNGETEEQLDLEAAKLIFADYKHIILTSKSHQKEKNGIKADRFRVFLFLEKPITNIFSFYATWDALKLKFPAIDPACKDASRFWYASPELISVNLAGNLIPVTNKADKSIGIEWQSMTVTTDKSNKGRLSRSSWDFINNGTDPGNWNRLLFKTAKDCQEQKYSLEETIELLSRPTLLIGNAGSLDNKDKRTIQSAFSSNPRYAPRQDRNSALRNVISECHLIIDESDQSQTDLVDLNTGERFDICKENIKTLLGRADFTEFQTHRTIYANFTYNPYAKKILFERSRGLIGYNMYTPPHWLRENYYKGKELPDGHMPQIIHRFLQHLTGGDEASYNYILDWLTVAITDRNYTMLTAVGDQGIGKGVFGYMLEKIFGSSNFKKTRDEVFKKSFNAQLEAKRLIYIDELALNSKEAHDRLKDMVNDTIEIEAKGKDAKTIKNYASFYISSNHIDALHLEPDDRRISALELTDKPLLKEFNREEIEEGILGDENVGEFAIWLSSREVKRDMRIPFRSQRFSEMMEAGLKNWQHYILYKLAPEMAGTEVNLIDVQRRLQIEFPNINPPGVTPITKLAKSFANIMRVEAVKGKRGTKRVIFLNRDVLDE